MIIGGEEINSGPKEKTAAERRASQYYYTHGGTRKGGNQVFGARGWQGNFCWDGLRTRRDRSGYIYESDSGKVYHCKHKPEQHLTLKEARQELEQRVFKEMTLYGGLVDGEVPTIPAPVKKKKARTLDDDLSAITRRQVSSEEAQTFTDPPDAAALARAMKWKERREEREEREADGESDATAIRLPAFDDPKV